MADNYLEKKMEEHRRGGATTVRYTSPILQPKGKVCLSHDLRTVFVETVERNPEVGAAIVTAFRNAGCRVAFTWHDSAAGAKLAQTTGSQHHNVGEDKVDAACERVAKAWGGVDARVKIYDSRVEMYFIGNGMHTTLYTGGNSSQVGEACLYLSLPHSRTLLGGGEYMLDADGTLRKR